MHRIDWIEVTAPNSQPDVPLPPEPDEPAPMEPAEPPLPHPIDPDHPFPSYEDVPPVQPIDGVALRCAASPLQSSCCLSAF